MQAFLERFTAPDGDDAGTRRYWRMIEEVARRERVEVPIRLDDVRQWLVGELPADGTHIVAAMLNNSFRYLDLWAGAIDAVMPQQDRELNVDSETFDVLAVHRAMRQAAERQHEHQQQTDLGLQAAGGPGNEAMALVLARHAAGEDEMIKQLRQEALSKKNATEEMPRELGRRFEVQLRAPSGWKPLPIRQVRAQHLGRLVVVRGIVTRCSEVKPLIRVATYLCDTCATEVYQEVTGKQFMPLDECPSTQCMTSGANKGHLNLQSRGSKFVKMQELRLQEPADHVPKGHIPRSIIVHARGELTRRCSPGDMASITGIFMPTPFTGFRGVRAGLIADTYLLAQDIEQSKKSYTDYVLTDELSEQIDAFGAEANVYNRLAKSIAPEIFGHVDVKKALLLLMVGGVTRVLPDGMKIRGDINCMLMGDPGVAKSQLLKHIASVAPRGIYTSGKGSSGVGLTAAVVRDPVSQEFVLEGGSLVLADMGICCIDEFDKMADHDRTAIHEVMEQQTISIAKAGITTSLNARTAILAAANPAYGRYNMRKSPAENINLPAALLSRFDLLFLLLDRPSYENDLALAKHITHVHRTSKHPELGFTVIDPDFMRAYIAQARRFEPHVPQELTDYIVSAYVNIRAEEASGENDKTYTTLRTLLSILRMAQSLARLRFEDTVEQGDVDEAMRLMTVSKSSLEDERNKRAGLDPVSAIYTLVRDMCAQSGSTTVQVDDLMPRVLARGFTQAQLNSCLDEYANLNVWQLSSNRSHVTFC